VFPLFAEHLPGMIRAGDAIAISAARNDEKRFEWSGLQKLTNVGNHPM